MSNNVITRNKPKVKYTYPQQVEFHARVYNYSKSNPTLTLRDVAAKYGRSHERIRQIIRRINRKPEEYEGLINL